MPSDTDSQVAEAAPASDGAADQTSSAEQQEPEGPSLLERMSERLFGRRDKQDEDNGASSQNGKETKGQTKPSEPVKREYTTDEINRLVQSEVDRRESKRTQQQQIEERRRLRREDPYAYAEQDEQEEARQESARQFESVIHDIGGDYDRAVLDTLMLHPALDSEREALLKLEGAGVGLEGRRLLVTEALKTLEKQWKAAGKAEAEDTLRRNPAFRKQVLSEFRRSDEHEEPDLIPANGSVGAGRTMDDWMRRSLGKYRPR